VTASFVAELLGLAALVVGAALFDYRAGLIVLGLVFILIGWALDRGDTA
jgi:hypothetical protein